MTVSLDDFVASHEGRCTDLDGVFGCQCVDLTNAWCDANGIPRFTGNAVDAAGQVNRGTTWVANDPHDLGQVPPAGALVVWGPTPDAHIGRFGHIAVALRAEPGAATFLSLDQNWFNSSEQGSAAARVEHPYAGLRGWHVLTALMGRADERHVTVTVSGRVWRDTAWLNWTDAQPVGPPALAGTKVVYTEARTVGGAWLDRIQFRDPRTGQTMPGNWALWDRDIDTGGTTPDQEASRRTADALPV